MIRHETAKEITATILCVTTSVLPSVKLRILTVKESILGGHFNQLYALKTLVDVPIRTPTSVKHMADYRELRVVRDLG